MKIALVALAIGIACGGLFLAWWTVNQEQAIVPAAIPTVFDPIVEKTPQAAEETSEPSPVSADVLSILPVEDAAVPSLVAASITFGMIWFPDVRPVNMIGFSIGYQFRSNLWFDIGYAWGVASSFRGGDWRESRNFVARASYVLYGRDSFGVMLVGGVGHSMVKSRSTSTSSPFFLGGVGLQLALPEGMYGFIEYVVHSSEATSSTARAGVSIGF